jgi:hypothetical protein
MSRKGEGGFLQVQRAVGAHCTKFLVWQHWHFMHLASSMKCHKVSGENSRRIRKLNNKTLFLWTYCYLQLNLYLLLLDVLIKFETEILMHAGCILCECYKKSFFLTFKPWTTSVVHLSPFLHPSQLQGEWNANREPFWKRLLYKQVSWACSL